MAFTHAHTYTVFPNERANVTDISSHTHSVVIRARARSRPRPHCCSEPAKEGAHYKWATPKGMVVAHDFSTWADAGDDDIMY